MNTRSITRALAIAALSVSSFALPAAALPPSSAPKLRSVARYEFRSHDAARAMRITVSDSAGTLVARYRRAGMRADRPMTVTVEGNDLLLTAITDRGPVQLLLREQNGGKGRAVVGEWLSGAEQGTLTGTVRR